MKKLSVIFMVIGCLIMVACSNDDEPKSGITSDYLEATMWDAELTGSAYPNHTPISAHFVMTFLNKESGKCIPAYDDDSYEGSFVYSVNKDMITFNGSITGNWFVVKRTKTQIVLRAYLPNEFNLVLNELPVVK